MAVGMPAAMLASCHLQMVIQNQDSLLTKSIPHLNSLSFLICGDAHIHARPEKLSTKIVPTLNTHITYTFKHKATDVKLEWSRVRMRSKGHALLSAIPARQAHRRNKPWAKSDTVSKSAI
jgi:hypothetical protein